VDPVHDCPHFFATELLDAGGDHDGTIAQPFAAEAVIQFSNALVL
jgi:hypothetical protein